MAWIENKQCPSCASVGGDNKGDNLSVYDDGEYCNACHYKLKYVTNDGANDTSRQIPSSNNRQLLTGYYDSIPDRGISKGVCEHVCYQLGTYTGTFKKAGFVINELVHIENWKDETNQIVGQKIRCARTKDFLWIQKNDNQLPLYGMDRWAPNPNTFVTVTEGVIDQLSILESQHGTQFPVVSISDGTSNAVKDVKKAMPWLLGFKYVVIAFDNDEQGIKAANECAKLFTPDKVRIAQWRFKDANEHLTKLGSQNEIKSILFNARIIKPSGIVTFGDIVDRLELPKFGYDWPWPTLSEMTYGIREGELITVMASPGTGKTEFVAETFIHLIKKYGLKIGLMSFEQGVTSTYLRNIGKLMGKRLHVPGVSASLDEVKKVGFETLHEKLYCYERAGLVDWTDVRNTLIYYKKCLNCDLIIIDNLSNIAAKFDKDERRGIDQAYLELSDLCITDNMTFLVICHLSSIPKDSSRTPYDEGGKVMLTDAKGSSGIGAHSTYVIGLERNSGSENELIKNTMTVRCLKDRNTGDSKGRSFKVLYDAHTGRLIE